MRHSTLKHISLRFGVFIFSVFILISACSITKQIYTEDELLQMFRSRSAEGNIQLNDVPFSTTPEMRRFAWNIVRGEHSSLGKALALVEAIISDRNLNIRYDPGSNVSAKEAFYHHRANCIAFTHLFIALSRAVNMKTTYVYVAEFERTYKKKHFIVNVHHICAGLHHGARFYIIDFAPGKDKKYHIYQEIDDPEAMAIHYNNLAFQSIQSSPSATATARKFIDTALSFKPDFALAYNTLGITYYLEKNAREAIKYFNKAHHLDPRQEECLANLASIYYSRGNYAKATEYFEKAIRIDPRDADMRIKLGFCYYRQNRLDKAEKQFLRAIRYQRNACSAYLGLGRIEIDRSRYGAALDYLDRVTDCNESVLRETRSLRNMIMVRLVQASLL